MRIVNTWTDATTCLAPADSVRDCRDRQADTRGDGPATEPAEGNISSKAWFSDCGLITLSLDSQIEGCESQLDLSGRT